MKVIAKMGTDYDHKILVEMTQTEFANCAGEYGHNNVSTEIGATIKVSEIYRRCQNLGTASTKQAADQLVALAALLRPLEGVVSRLAAVDAAVVDYPPTKEPAKAP